MPSTLTQTRPRTGKIPECEGCPPPPDTADFWLFAYGSLIWDPGFPFEEARPAKLMGFHRAFCLYSTRYRGTPEKPGLVLGLDKGGSCRGIAYRVANEHRETTMAYLWDREMLNQSYHCMDLSITLLDGREVVARTFVIDRDGESYAGKLPLEDAARIIRDAHGQRGPNAAYLANTVEHLERLGLHDRRLAALLTAVKA
ncbi:MAG: gamma-glutamylcyclotransferase [Alphaproteobacteria bacterium]|nr:gamma-glutamylcyclotransferase [Alphaproteobacteria bacterium]